VQVERRTELIKFEEAPSRIIAYLKRPDGEQERCEAAYIAGCDGAHSTVREALQIGFPGGVYSHLFYVADAEASGAAVNGELNIALDRTDFLVVFPLKGEGRARLIGTVREEADHQRDELSWNDVSRRVLEWMPIDVKRVNWFSTYRVHHRVAGHFRKGGAFLLGDAAHIHSPVGGQGMNTGIGDAVNLGWKLAQVWAKRAPDSLLDTYETERIAFARQLVATTDRAFRPMVAGGIGGEAMRRLVAPFVVGVATRFAFTRHALFRTLSQTHIHYPDSPLSRGRSGDVCGGHRLPWIADADNFAPLQSLDWQVHVFEAANESFSLLCAGVGLPIHVLPWTTGAQTAGFDREGAYLIRPDGYVSAAASQADAAAVFGSFFADTGCRFAAPDPTA
jgi:FAD binding domain